MSKTLYEYFIDDGKLIQLSYPEEKYEYITAFQNKKCIKLKAGRTKSWKYVSEKEIDIIINNHLFSFDGDMDLARYRFILLYKSRIKQLEEKCQIYELLLERLEEGE